MAQRALQRIFILATLVIAIALIVVLTPHSAGASTAEAVMLAPTNCATAAQNTTPTFVPPGRKTPVAAASAIPVPCVSSLVPAAATPSLAPSKTITPAQSPTPTQRSLRALDAPSGLPTINFPDFCTSTGMSLVGSASFVGCILRVVPAVPVGRSGAAWYTAKQNVVNDFSTTFTFRISNGIADGFAFVIQNSPFGSEAIGNPGCEMGYGGIRPSIDVEFDIYQNNYFCDAIGDPSDNHVAVQVDGYVGHIPGNPYYPYGTLGLTNLSSVTPPINLKDGNVHLVTISYTRSTLTLTVAIDNPTAPQLTVGSVDFTSRADVSGNAWVGFAGGTGADSADHDILSWSFTGTELSTTTPTFTYTPSSTMTTSPTYTPSRTLTPSRTPTNTRTPTYTRTATNTRTPTRTPTNTRTPTITRTPAPTATWFTNPANYPFGYNNLIAPVGVTFNEIPVSLALGIRSQTSGRGADVAEYEVVKFMTGTQRTISSTRTRELTALEMSQLDALPFSYIIPGTTEKYPVFWKTSAALDPNTDSNNTCGPVALSVALNAISTPTAPRLTTQEVFLTMINAINGIPPTPITGSMIVLTKNVPPTPLPPQPTLPPQIIQASLTTKPIDPTRPQGAAVMQKTITVLGYQSVLVTNGAFTSLSGYVADQIQQDKVVFALVGIDDKSYRGLVANTTKAIGHYVLIIGTSTQLDADKTKNWLKTFNPFNNQVEYYKESDFIAAASNNTPNWFILTIGG